MERIARWRILRAIGIGMLWGVGASSCAGVRTVGDPPAGPDWGWVIPVDRAAGINFDLKARRHFQYGGFNIQNYGAFSEGLCVAENRADGKKGYIDRTGRVVIPFRYDAAGAFREGTAYVRVAEADGIIDQRGRWVVQPGRYGALSCLSEGRCAFRKGDLWGFLDARSGKVVLPPAYKEAGIGAGLAFREGLCLVKNEAGERVYIDRDGRVRIRLPNADWRGAHFWEGLARVTVRPSSSNGGPLDWGRTPIEYRSGFMDRDGRMVIEPRFGTAGDFSEGLAPVTVTEDGSFGYDMDELTGETTPFPDAPEPPPAWGFINTKGEVVVPMVYEKALGFREGLAPVRQGGKWGYIDRQGRMVIGAGFEDARRFRKGIAEVVIGGKVAYIDKSGNLVVRTDLSGMRF
jgi:hypothetical protein